MGCRLPAEERPHGEAAGHARDVLKRAVYMDVEDFGPDLHAPAEGSGDVVAKLAAQLIDGEPHLGGGVGLGHGHPAAASDERHTRLGSQAKLAGQLDNRQQEMDGRKGEREGGHGWRWLGWLGWRVVARRRVAVRWVAGWRIPGRRIAGRGIAVGPRCRGIPCGLQRRGWCGSRRGGTGRGRRALGPPVGGPETQAG